MFIALEAEAKHPLTQEVIIRRRSCVDYLWNSDKKLLLKFSFTDLLSLFGSLLNSYSSPECPELRPMATGRQSHRFRVNPTKK